MVVLVVFEAKIGEKLGEREFDNTKDAEIFVQECKQNMAVNNICMIWNQKAINWSRNLWGKRKTWEKARFA